MSQYIADRNLPDTDSAKIDTYQEYKQWCINNGKEELWHTYNSELKRLIRTIRMKKIKNMFD